MQASEWAEFLRRLSAADVLRSQSRRGCSDEELRALEALYGVTLPTPYREYLRLLGHDAGRLFRHDHLAVSYPYVLNMTTEVRQSMRDGSWEVPQNFAVPRDALFICSRLDSHYEFIRCNSGESAAVQCFNYGEWVIREMSPSIQAWLEMWFDEAKRAIASGYFTKYPGGTTP